MANGAKTTPLTEATPIILTLLVASILAFGALQFDVPAQQGRSVPVAAGTITLLLMYVIYGLFTGRWKVSLLYLGEDGRPSTSKFQAFIWTVVVIFSYTGLLAMRMNASLPIGDQSEVFPVNLLLAMGFSFTSVVAAKGITLSQINNGEITKPPAVGNTPGLAKEDSGAIDLTKMQMLWWTFIAVGVYLVRVFTLFQDGIPTDKPFALPDIDAALMVMMGLSHGVYIGKKLVTTDTPNISPLAITSGPPGTKLQLLGTAFGATQGQVTMDGVPIAIGKWTDTAIDIVIPGSHPTKGAWAQTQDVKFDVIAGGRSSVTPVAFSVTLPTIANAAAAGAIVTITGSGFGFVAGSVSINSAPAAVSSWGNSTIVVTAAAVPAAGAAVSVTAGSVTVATTLK